MTTRIRKTRTMQKTAEEGKEFLKKSWGDKKFEKVEKELEARDEAVEEKPVEDKPIEGKSVEEKPVEDKPAEEKPAEEEKSVEDKPAEAEKPVEPAAAEESVVPEATVSDEVEETPKKKAKLAKNMTMAATAEEGKLLLQDAEIDSDAKTRNQSKTIKELTKEPVEEEEEEEAPKRKRSAAIKKQSTMQQAAKEAEELLKNSGTIANTRSNTRKANAAAAAAVDVEEPKPKLTKSRTMKETAKEGKAYLESLKNKKKK